MKISLSRKRKAWILCALGTISATAYSIYILTIKDPYAYIYAIHNNSVSNSSATETSIIPTTDDLVCQIQYTKSFDCKVMALHDNNILQHTIKQIEVDEKDDVESELVESVKSNQPFFQIKFIGANNWNKLTNIHDTLKITSKSLPHHKYADLTIHFAKYRDKKMFETIFFIAKSTNSTDTYLDTKLREFECSFDSEPTTHVCSIKSFSKNEDSKLNKTYKELKFDPDTASPIIKNKHYWIQFGISYEIGPQNFNPDNHKQIHIHSGESKITFTNMATAFYTIDYSHILIIE